MYNVFAASWAPSSPHIEPMQLTEAKDDAMHARLACDPHGRVWVAYYKWQKMGLAWALKSRDREVFIRRFDGYEWSKEVQVSPTDVPTYEDHCDAAVVAFGDGVMVAWSWDYHQPEGYTKDAEAPTIFVRTVGPDLSLGEPRHVSGKGIDTTPSITAEGNGSVWCTWDSLSWDSQAQRNCKGVFAAAIPPGAKRGPGQAKQLCSGQHNVCSPVVVAKPDGGVTLVWAEAQRLDRWRLRSVDLRAGEATQPKPTKIKTGKTPRFPSAVYDSAGQMWVAYAIDHDGGTRVVADPVAP
jgi:hypothetical protein